MPNPPINLAVLVSGSGTTLQYLIAAIKAKKLAAEIRIVIASKPGIMAIERAQWAGLPVVVSSTEKVFEHCDAAGADLVCLAGWLQLLKIPASYAGRVVNIHPSLLPEFGGKGMYGIHVHEAVLKAKKTASGCTVHIVDDQYDHGPIVLQRKCEVKPGDTPQALAKRVFEEEKIAYPEAIRILQQRLSK